MIARFTVWRNEPRKWVAEDGHHLPSSAERYIERRTWWEVMVAIRKRLCDEAAHKRDSTIIRGSQNA